MDEFRVQCFGTIAGGIIEEADCGMCQRIRNELSVCIRNMDGTTQKAF